MQFIDEEVFFMDGGFHEFQLGNGTGLYVYPTDKFKTTLIRVVFSTNLDEETTKTGLVPFVLKRGTKTHPDNLALARFCEQLYGAYLNGDVLKIGEQQLVQFTLSVLNDRYISAQIDLLGEGLGLLREVICDPLVVHDGFKPSYVQTEANNLREKIRGLINDKRRYATFRCIEEMCKGEPFARNKYGNEAELSNQDPKALYGFYRELIDQCPMDIYVVGSVEPDEVYTTAEEVFGFTRSGGYALKQTFIKTQPDKIKEVIEEKDVNQSLLVMGYRLTNGVTYAHSDYPAMLFWNGVLGHFPHSKLFMNVRERESLAYFAFSQLDAAKGIALAIAGIDGNNYEKTREIISNQVEDMKAGRITEREFEDTRRGLLNGLLAQEDSAGSLISNQLRGVVSGRVRPLTEQREMIQQVQLEDIVEFAQGVELSTVYLLKNVQAGA